MSKIKALDSLLVDIKHLEDIAYHKLESIRESRRAVESKLRSLRNEEKDVRDISAKNAATPVQGEMFPPNNNIMPMQYRPDVYGGNISIHICNLLKDNRHLFCTSKSITEVLRMAGMYKHVEFHHLRNKVQRALRYMRTTKSHTWDSLRWSEVARPSGKKGTMYKYSWGNNICQNL